MNNPAVKAKVIYSTEALFKVNAKGHRSFWQGIILQEGDDYFTSSYFWEISKDGKESKRKESVPTLITPKNVGKSNETKGYTQALLEVSSDFRKKQDAGYSDDGVSKFLPMLAQPFDSSKAIFPAYIQPKLDGQRVFYKDGLFFSRHGKELIKSVTAHLVMPAVAAGVVLDGELMLPDGYTFQQTIAAIKKFSSNSNKLVFHLFDMVDTNNPTATTVTRQAYLQGLQLSEGLTLVATTLVNNLSEFRAEAAQCLAVGYEGAIWRSPGAPYQVNIRSKGLLKYKEFEDSEFLVTGIIDGVGREVGCAILECEATNGAMFTVRPVGSESVRKAMFDNKASIIGKYFTVKHQGLTDGGLPRCPVGKALRDYD